MLSRIELASSSPPLTLATLLPWFAVAALTVRRWGSRIGAAMKLRRGDAPRPQVRPSPRTRDTATSTASAIEKVALTTIQVHANPIPFPHEDTAQAWGAIGGPLVAARRQRALVLSVCGNRGPSEIARAVTNEEAAVPMPARPSVSRW